MSLPEQSLIYVLVGILAGVSGYFTRRIQKFEDSKDNSNLKVLPSLFFCLLSFKQSANIFIQTKDLPLYRASIVEILTNLKDKISSGELLPTEDLDSLLISFHQNGVTLESNIGSIINDSDQLPTRITELVNLLSGTSSQLLNWLTINPRQMIEDSQTISMLIRSKIQKYRPFSTMVLVSIVLIGAIIGEKNF